ncbi:MAG: ABC transporter ATP-binding protein, partial [Bacteroidetes bacterium]|nr:ABC transporter ATP-binding protein [Bacteroidota bacterium]
GTMSVFGSDTVRDYKKLRTITGYMPGRFSLYHDLTVEENLNFYATVFGTTVKKNYHLIKEIYIHIEPFANRPAGKLSGGMKQKLALSCALIHKPSLLILDEPTTGVDAVSRKEFWDMLQNLREKEITILVSTPYMDEAMKCDSVSLVQSGRILATGTPEAVRRGFAGKVWHASAGGKYNLLLALRKYPETLTAEPFGGSVHVTFRNDMPGTDIDRFMEAEGLSGFSVSEAEPAIEDRFLQLMRKRSASD